MAAARFLKRKPSERWKECPAADGGMWKLEAKKYILSYFDDALIDEINAGNVIVMM